MRKNTFGKPVDTICGHVKGKSVSGGDTQDKPLLYLVKEDEAYVVDGPDSAAVFGGTSATSFDLAKRIFSHHGTRNSSRPNDWFADDVLEVIAILDRSDQRPLSDQCEMNLRLSGYRTGKQLSISMKWETQWTTPPILHCCCTELTNLRCS